MELKCVFSIDDYDSYVCTVNSASITKRNTEIKSIQGKHMEGYCNDNVAEIIFEKGNIVEYFPSGLDEIFPELSLLKIEGCGLKEISRADLVGLKDLCELYIEENSLTSLPNDLFEDMHILAKVSFNKNKLKRLSSKLLKPLLHNGVECVDFRNNTKIDLLYDDECHDRDSTNSLEELMMIIDKNCGSLEWRQTAELANEEMWTSGQLSDFTIVAGEEHFKVHKIELAKHSSVFMAMFKNDNKESRDGKMIIKDFNSEVVKEFLRYIYTGEIPDVTNAMDLFAMAAKYDVPKLKSESEEMILENLNVSNAFDILNFGNLFGSDQMKKLAFIELKKMFPDHKIPVLMMNQPELFKDVVEIQRAAYSKLSKIISNVNKI